MNTPELMPVSSDASIPSGVGQWQWAVPHQWETKAEDTSLTSEALGQRSGRRAPAELPAGLLEGNADKSGKSGKSGSAA